MGEVVLDCVCGEVARWLERGARLDEVQRELIEDAPGLSEDERDALWLFAWSYRPSGQHAADHLRASLAR